MLGQRLFKVPMHGCLGVVGYSPKAKEGLKLSKEACLVRKVLGVLFCDQVCCVLKVAKCLSVPP